MVQRRSIVSTAISAAVHAAVIALVLWTLGSPPERPTAQPPELVAFDVVMAPPAPPPPPPHPGRAAPAPAGARAPSPLGHRGHDAPRSALRPSASHDGELTISVDTPVGPDADGLGTEHGVGTAGLGAGLGGNGPGGNGAPIARLEIPEPPHPSAARPPRPKYDYSEVTIHGSRAYHGKQIKLLLTVDAHGVVRGARILQSVEFQFDMRAIRKALQFEFEPAYDPQGQPTTGLIPWIFVMTL